MIVEKIADIRERYLSRVSSLDVLTVEADLAGIGRIQPGKHPQNVDLPEPLPPVMKTSSPGCRVKSIGPILNVASENLST